MRENKQADGEPIVIKKYANRRLYNTRSSSYITLDHLAKMTREEVEFRVIDAKTGSDITHSILTQIIMDEESGGQQMLPTSFLRQLIGMYGNSLQSLVPGYLEASMQHFRENQSKLRKAIEESIGANPLTQLAQRNIEMLKSAASGFKPGGRQGDKAEAKAGEAKAAGVGERPIEAKADGRPAGEVGEIAVLRAQMAEMQKKLDALSDSTPAGGA
ncbi:MAG: polyhydroxyalkanoate synthesis repressor PhaR [Novosphingobium sp.]